MKNNVIKMKYLDLIYSLYTPYTHTYTLQI